MRLGFRVIGLGVPAPKSKEKPGCKWVLASESWAFWGIWALRTPGNREPWLENLTCRFGANNMCVYK